MSDAQKRKWALNKIALSGWGKCPVRHTWDIQENKIPTNNAEQQSSHGLGTNADDKLLLDDGVINPRNMMPSISENPLPSDKHWFSKHREVSTIPKTGEDGWNWIYPSAQQFYNAIRRRGKVSEEDKLEEDNTMNAIIYAHNITNERTWTEILEWEAMHYAWVIQLFMSYYAFKSHKCITI